MRSARKRPERRCSERASGLPRHDRVDAAGGLSGALSRTLPLLGLSKRTLSGGRQRLRVGRDIDDLVAAGGSLAQPFRAVDRDREIEYEIDDGKYGIQERVGHG